MSISPILSQCGNAGGLRSQAPRKSVCLSGRSIAVAAATTTSVTTAATSATTAAAATAAAASVAATPSAARFAGLGFIDGQPPAVVLSLIEASDCCLGLSVGIHFDKSESLRPVCITIHDNLCALHSPELGEQRVGDRTHSRCRSGVLHKASWPRSELPNGGWRPAGCFPGREERGFD